MTRNRSTFSVNGVKGEGNVALNGDSHGKYIVNGHDETENADHEKKHPTTDHISDVPDVKFKNEEKSKNETDTSDEKKIGIFGLFRYSSCMDKVLLCIGAVCAALAGCCFPLNMFIYGRVANALILNEVFKSVVSNMNGTFPPDNFTTTNGMSFSELKKYEHIFQMMKDEIIWFCVLAVVVFVCIFLAVACFSISAEHQIHRIRQKFFQSILRQEISWFDTHEGGELNSRIAEDVHLIADGIGDKFATMLQWFSTFIAAYVIAFVIGWKLTLSVVGFCPVIILVGATLVRFMRNLAKEESQAYSKAGSIAEEALGAIRTVMAFNGQNKECARYNSHLHHAKSNSVKKGILVGLSNSVVWLLLYGAFAVAFWYGVKLIQDQEEGFDPGSTLTVFIGVMVGSMSLGNALPTVEILGNARGAAQKVFEIIELTSKIDPSSTEGKMPDKFEGNIEFKDVEFEYPARPDAMVLRGMSLKVRVGQTVALVGSSGCGKSTVVQLLQRFYDPPAGQVLLDGCEISTINVNWLRRQIGVVSQEPVLFATTVAENIRYGRLDVTMDEIIAAAREANAHDFISQFPDGYDTLVGERGAQMSGGQKQRIAIARALVRNPKILLLDEATSALDNESESVVQAALEKAQEGRTTIVIAHRLSTIRNADIIYGIQGGQVVEQGTHSELMQEDGLYSQLVYQQSHQMDTNEEVADELEHELFDGDDEVKLPSINNIKPHYNTIQSSNDERPTSTISKRKDEEKVHNNEDEGENEDDNVTDVSVIKVLRMNSPEWYYILGACMCSVLAGSTQPVFAIIFAEFLKVFTMADKEEQTNKANFLVGMVVCVAVGNGVIRLLMSICYSTAGAKLTARFRRLAFRSLIWQDIPFFDDPKNRVGVLTTRLALDSSLVQGAAGNKVGAVLESLSTVSVAVIIAFIHSWKLTLVIFAFMPLMVVAGVIHSKKLTGFSKGDKSVTEEAGKLTSEVINNIRTVASLTREQSFIEKYTGFLDVLYTNGKRRSFLNGVMSGLSLAFMFFAYAAAFAYGGYLVQYEDLPFQNVFKVFIAIVFGGMSVGRQSSYTPDYNKGKIAAGRLFNMIEMKPSIDAASDEGEVMEEFSGSLLLDDVHFRYSSRPEIEVLRGLSLTIQTGETVAMVGTSGCGKSTTVQLLERFYDTESGQILADGKNIKSLDLKWFRKQIGIVSQEPCLFDCSIAENIAYGDNSRDVAMDEIITAARKANIHNFIDSLPLGYDTNVGDKGTQLSGGQKQRVAIARALIRNPKILLLDEATSALDAESERVVQEALDKARAGRTCLVIAHRLSTIQNSDRIAILHKGEVVELGSHSELLAKKGIYYNLSQHNSKKTDL
ncbi:ATP-dependent translocase ABCB1-like [Ylistrum balloti]|uniref:ATP-dependent translocase ABCB1-like n=1 Tax=Ylistrum balloti TaxID=509963 RepID=UPI002905F675|nr:ATP-dependent translocase ABCB1-like [Ylistrum balloti]